MAGKPDRDTAAHRVYRNMSFAPSTEARLAALTRASGQPRGRIVDMCVHLIDVCDACRGKGCHECGGLGLLPVQRDAQ